jgi:hypothetical protein
MHWVQASSVVHCGAPDDELAEQPFSCCRPCLDREQCQPKTLTFNKTCPVESIFRFCSRVESNPNLRILTRSLPVSCPENCSSTTSTCLAKRRITKSQHPVSPRPPTSPHSIRDHCLYKIRTSFTSQTWLAYIYPICGLALRQNACSLSPIDPPVTTRILPTSPTHTHLSCPSTAGHLHSFLLAIARFLNHVESDANHPRSPHRHLFTTLRFCLRSIPI